MKNLEGMNRLWQFAFCFVLLVIAVLPSDSFAVQSRQWVRLADCIYIDHEYNDGDSFHVRCGAQDFIIRLYFVDAPETNMRQPERVREQAEYFGITMDDALRTGKVATETVEAALRSPFLVWTRWASASGRTKIPRYFGFVETTGQGLAELLVGRGLARTKGVTASSPTGEPSRERLQVLQEMERQAQAQGLGAWAKSAAAGERDVR